MLADATYYQFIADTINTHGRYLQGVFPTITDEGPAFTYTIGNHALGKPELLVVGPDPRSVGSMLNYICDTPELMTQITDGKDNDFLDLGGKWPLKIARVGPRAKADFTIQVGRYYNTEDYDVVQLILCDPDGRFPGDYGCAEPWNKWGNIEETR